MTLEPMHLLVAPGVALCAWGVWSVWGSRTGTLEGVGRLSRIVPGPLRRVQEGASPTTRTVLGLAMLLTGYHAFAYAFPGVLSMHVPWHRAWIVLAVLIVAPALSLWLDKWEGRGPDGDRESGLGNRDG
jgi:hypothetical protein